MSDKAIVNGGTATLTAQESFHGAPAPNPQPLDWATDLPGIVTLTPSADTFSCLVTGVALGSVNVTASVRGAPSPISATKSFDVVLGVDGVTLTIS